MKVIIAFFSFMFLSFSIHATRCTKAVNIFHKNFSTAKLYDEVRINWSNGEVILGKEISSESGKDDSIILNRAMAIYDTSGNLLRVRWAVSHSNSIVVDIELNENKKVKKVKSFIPILLSPMDFSYNHFFLNQRTHNDKVMDWDLTPESINEINAVSGIGLGYLYGEKEFIYQDGILDYIIPRTVSWEWPLNSNQASGTLRESEPVIIKDLEHSQEFITSWSRIIRELKGEEAIKSQMRDITEHTRELGLGHLAIDDENLKIAEEMNMNISIFSQLTMFKEIVAKAERNAALIQGMRKIVYPKNKNNEFSYVQSILILEDSIVNSKNFQYIYLGNGHFSLQIELTVFNERGEVLKRINEGNIDFKLEFTQTVYGNGPLRVIDIQGDIEGATADDLIKMAGINRVILGDNKDWYRFDIQERHESTMHDILFGKTFEDMVEYGEYRFDPNLLRNFIQTKEDAKLLSSIPAVENEGGRLYPTKLLFDIFMERPVPELTDIFRITETSSIVELKKRLTKENKELFYLFNEIMTNAKIQDPSSLAKNELDDLLTPYKYRIANKFIVRTNQAEVSAVELFNLLSQSSLRKPKKLIEALSPMGNMEEAKENLLRQIPFQYREGYKTKLNDDYKNLSIRRFFVTQFHPSDVFLAIRDNNYTAEMLALFPEDWKAQEITDFLVMKLPEFKSIFEEKYRGKDYVYYKSESGDPWFVFKNKRYSLSFYKIK